MSSQASNAGRAEAKVRQKLVESGAVDVMIDIRGNFFYTRTVPCQLWFFDRAKERDATRRNQVLMIDVRNIYREVTRAIYDFSPEQQKNISAVVWLYRGQTERFLGLVEDYLAQAVAEGQATAEPLLRFECELSKLTDLVRPLATEAREPDPIGETWAQLTSTQAALSADLVTFASDVSKWTTDWELSSSCATRENMTLHAAREILHDMSERCLELAERMDLAANTAGQVVDIAVNELAAKESAIWANSDINRARKNLENSRSGGVESLRRPQYFVRQADWLQERFPDAELRDVEGLVKLVTLAEIEMHDWSLTPGRYVGIPPYEEDEGIDFRDTLRSIHTSIQRLDNEATELMAQIARNFEKLGV